VKNSSTQQVKNSSTQQVEELSVHQDKQVLKQNLNKAIIVFSLEQVTPFKADLYLKSKIAAESPRQPLPPDDPNSSKAQSWGANNGLTQST